ncbi:probable serine hydrolase isoform X2 [Pectinophora gossypiella]|nr:probable serine hydrolase isoform X2 [Pectinophora gossypiella]
MELPGNGRSDPYPPGLPVSLMDLVYSLEVVRRHFRWDQFIYLAHSVATTIGRLYNVSNPGRMSRVIELDQVTPSFVMVTPENFADWYNILYTQYFDRYDFYNSSKENAPKYTMEQAVERVMRVRQLPPEAARATVERWSEPAGHGLIRFTIDQRTKHLLRPPFSAEQVKALFTSLPTPTLGIIAEKSVKNGYFTNTSFLLEDYGNYRVRKVDGGHDVHITNPERMAPFVSQFLLHGIDGLDRKAKL